jgi:peptide/nickel transport system substrate-binding protein
VVEGTSVVDDATVRLAVGDANRAVGERALRVPILPEAIWRERTDVATIAGMELDTETTEAVVTNNRDPVGSGPLRFVEATAEESVVFERNPDHFLVRGAIDVGETDDGSTAPDAQSGSTDDLVDDLLDGIPKRYHGKPAFDRLVVRVAPSDVSAVQAIADGLADATVSNLGPDAVPRIGRSPDARLVSGRSASFSHVGYNTRRAPLSNPRFRGVLASLLDKALLAEEAFDGYATPATSPLAASPEWVPPDLEWRGDEDPVHPFIGEDGSFDADAAQTALRDAGYRFDEEGRLLAEDP